MVKRTIASQVLACVPCALVSSQVHLLRLHTAPPPFHTHVIAGPAAAIPPDPHPSLLPPLREGPTGELRPLIRLADLRLALPERLLQGLDTTRHSPGD